MTQPGGVTIRVGVDNNATRPIADLRAEITRIGTATQAAARTANTALGGIDTAARGTATAVAGASTDATRAIGRIDTALGGTSGAFRDTAADAARQLGNIDTAVTGTATRMRDSRGRFIAAGAALGGGVVDGFNQANLPGAVSAATDRATAEAGKSGESFGKKYGAAIGAAVAALGIGALVADAMDWQVQNAKTAGALGALDPAYVKELGAEAGKLYVGGYAESAAEANDLLVQTAQRFGEDVDAATQLAYAKKSKTIADAYGQDVAGVETAAQQMVNTGLAGSVDQAIDIISKGFQQGTGRADDYLDTLNEYGVQFQKLGIDGQTATGLLSQGLAAGARNTDLVADAFKEFSIRAINGSKLTGQGYAALGLDAKQMSEDIASGGPKAAAGTQLVLDRLKAMKDPVAAAAAATALFGTQSEDLGKALYAMDPSKATAAIGDVAGAATQLGTTMYDTASSGITTFWRTLKMSVVDYIVSDVLPVVSVFVGWLQDKVGPALLLIGQWIDVNVLPMLAALWSWFGDKVIPILADVWSWVTDKLLPALGDFGSAIGDVIMPILTEWYTWLGKKVVPALKDAAGWIGDHIVPALESMAGWLKDNAEWLRPLVVAVLAGVAAFKLWELGVWAVAAATKAWTAIQVAFDAVMDANPVMLVVIAIAALAAGLYYAYTHSEKFREIVDTIGDGFQWLWGIIQDVAKWIAEKWSWLWDNVLQPIFGWIGDRLTAVGGFFTWLWEKVISPVWTWVGGAISDAWAIIDPILTWLGEAVQGVGDFFTEFFLNPIGAALTGIKGFIGDIKTAIDEFLVWVGLKNGAAPAVVPVPVTITEPDGSQTILYNSEDVNGSVDGSMYPQARGGVFPGYAPGRDSIHALVSPGEAVLVPEVTRALGADRINAWNAAGVARRYSLGGVVQNLGKSVVNQHLPSWFVSTVAGADDTGADTGGGAPSSVPQGSGVERWRSIVLAALGLVGQSAGYADITLRRMNQESSGNPAAINLTDSNARKGTPSKGLMQVIDPTFRSNAMPGHNTDIWDPLSNILASMRYAVGRYGSLPAAYNKAGGYDSGGWLMPGHTGANNLSEPEAVLTPAQWSNVEQLTRGAAGNITFGPGSITIHVDGTDLSADELADTIGAALTDKLAALLRDERERSLNA